MARGYAATTTTTKTMDSKRYEGIGRKIKRLRLKLNMTQALLADMIGVSEASISLYERNLQLPPIETLGRIADVFEVNVRYFFS